MLMDNERKCLKIFHDLASAEEGFLKQKSRVQWLKLGDQNTSFFHKSVKARNARSRIKVLTSGNGCRIDDSLAIKEEAVVIRTPPTCEETCDRIRSEEPL